MQERNVCLTAAQHFVKHQLLDVKNTHCHRWSGESDKTFSSPSKLLLLDNHQEAFTCTLTNDELVHASAFDIYKC